MMMFLTIYCIILMFFIPPSMQLNLYEVETKFFKRIKVKRLAFLFRGIGGKNSVTGEGDVKEYGVVIALFVIQVMGYILAFLSGILVLLLYFIYHLDLMTIAIVVLSILGFEMLVVAITTSICILISKRKRKQEDYG